VIGFTGFIRAWNAIDRLIDFVAAHGTDLDLHIMVVGDGPAHRPLKQYASERGVAERLTITGVVSREQVGHYIAAFDVAVIPGLTPYSSPLKLFEYLQLGRAVVAPNTENIREILTDEHDALLFEPELVGNLEATLLRLCRDPALRFRLGSSARQTIIDKSLTWNRNAERVLDIAQALLAANPHKGHCTPSIQPLSPDSSPGARSRFPG
jgi:glycosyltransferase involved in cell wall biosynthesis